MDLIADFISTPPRSYSALDDAYRGGILAVDSNTIRLEGHLYRAYQLPDPYLITQFTRLKFQFSVPEEANGHALCLDFNAKADNAKRCIFIAGSDAFYTQAYNPPQFDMDLQSAKIVGTHQMINVALGKPAYQSSTSHYQMSAASNAVDGYIDPTWRPDNYELNEKRNSIAMTNPEANPWWEVNLYADFMIAHIVIHKAKGIEGLQLSAMVITISDTNGSSQSTEISDDSDVVNVEIASLGSKVRITLPTTEGVLALAEVLVIGYTSLPSIDFDVPIGRMLNEDISFGFPIWDGVRNDIALDKQWEVSGNMFTLTLDGKHVITDIVVKDAFQDAAGMYLAIDTIEGSDITNVFEYNIGNTDTNVHIPIPPNIVGNRLRIEAQSSSVIQVIGSALPVGTDDIYGGSVPVIVNFIGFIQDTHEDFFGISIFAGMELYEDTAEDQLIQMNVVTQFRSLTVKIHTTPEVCPHAGSFGNEQGDSKNAQATFNQDFGDGLAVADDGNVVTLYGNVWKAFKLPQAYPVTISTRLKFDVKVTNEAEGHGICVEDDLNEDPFDGAHVRCVLVAGSQFTVWNHVKRANLALDQPTSQSGSGPRHAGLAVDGNTNSFTDTGAEIDPWWQVQIASDLRITDIIIYNRFDLLTERLDDFSVFILTNDGNENIIYEQNYLDQASEIFHISHIELDESQIVEAGLQVKIQLNTHGVAFPHMLGEVKVYGKPVKHKSVTIDVSVADLFFGPDPNIRYIAFIQDNDNDPLVGESSFSNIKVYDAIIESGTLPMVSLASTFV